MIKRFLKSLSSFGLSGYRRQLAELDAKLPPETPPEKRAVMGPPVAYRALFGTPPRAREKGEGGRK
jgi:hypothetical protein